VAGTLGEDQDIRGVLAFVTIHAAYELPDRGDFPELLQEAYRRNGLPWDPASFRSHSDANLLWAEGIRPVILDPGQLERAHSQDEGVSFPQVCRAAELYLDVLHLLRA
jgi:acetylornithine deacetylase